MDSIYYLYKELVTRALSAKGTREDIARLAEWYEKYGERYWNGEYYQIDGRYILRPIYKQNGEAYKIAEWSIEC